MRPIVGLEVPSVFAKVQIYSSPELPHHFATSRQGHVLPKATYLSVSLFFYWCAMPIGLGMVLRHDRLLNFV